MGVLKRYTIKNNVIVGSEEIKRDKLQQSKPQSQKKIYTKEMLQQMVKKVAEKVEKARTNKT